MKDRLQPKLPCHAPHKSPVPSSLLATPYARTGVTAVKGPFPIDVLSRDLDVSSSSEEELSNSEDKSPKQPLPPMDPNELVRLDDLKLRINLKLLKKEEAKLRTRSRRESEISETSCSMEEEDLPLFDDNISELSFDSSSSSPSPSEKRQKFSPADEPLTQENSGDEVSVVPDREPTPVDQEDFIRRRVEGMQQYDP
jgi:hypothetical protein